MQTAGDDDMEAGGGETPDTTHILLNVDVLPAVVAALPASMQQIILLRMQRRVCMDFRNAVDICLQKKRWILSYATHAMDFRTDFAITRIPITPPISLIRGITRMLRMGELAELVAGMQEFVADRALVEVVLAEVNDYLSVHAAGHATVADLAMRQMRVRVAAQAGMPAVVAWAMRWQANSTSIQQNGSHILAYFTYPPTQADSTDGNCNLQVYFIGALADAMHDNLHNCKVQQSCLDAMRAITVDMLEDGAHLHNALVQPGKHNVLSLIIDAMETHMADEHLVLAALHMANVYGYITCDEGLNKHMRGFDINKAELVILSGIRKYYVLAPDIAKLCITVQLRLVGSNLCKMKHIYDTVLCSLNAVQIHTHDAELVQQMQKLYCEIMRQMQSYHEVHEQQKRQHMQDYAADRGAIQLSLSSFAHCLNMAVSSATTDVDSEDTFYMLMALCEGNVRVKALIVDAQAVHILEGMRKVLYKSSREEEVFTKNLDELKQMLLVDDGASHKLPAHV